ARLRATRHVRALVLGLPAIGPLRSTDASGGRLDQVVGAGWIAVGDAALSFDPISAQGIFNALYTGMKAGQAVDAALDGSAAAVQASACRRGPHTRRGAGAAPASGARREPIREGEPRWPDPPFWQRRRARLSTAI